jgi:hypothetical protein
MRVLYTETKDKTYSMVLPQRHAAGHQADILKVTYMVLPTVKLIVLNGVPES